MIKVYTPEMREWLAENVKGVYYRDLVKIFNEKFGTNITVKALRTKVKIWRLSNGLQGKGRPAPKLFTDEQIEFVRQVAKGSSYAQITIDVNSKFGLSMTKEQIEGLMCREKITTGTGGFFQKGHVPQNKGKKMSPEQYKKCSGTMFKKGNVPKNYKPVGSKRILKEGYVEIKIADPNQWELEHRLVWEKAHGPIPHNCVIIHLDQNKQNNSLENLKMVHRNITPIMHHLKGWSRNKNITDLSLNIAQLKKTIKEKRRKI